MRNDRICRAEQRADQHVASDAGIAEAPFQQSRPADQQLGHPSPQIGFKRDVQEPEESPEEHAEGQHGHEDLKGPRGQIPGMVRREYSLC